MMIGVTKWPYDQDSIDDRQGVCDHYGDPSDQCKNEKWFIRELSQQLAEKEIQMLFYLKNSFFFVLVWRHQKFNVCFHGLFFPNLAWY